MESNLLSINELSEKLNLPVSWIYSRTRINEIPHYKIGKYVRFNESEVWDWLKKQNESE